MSWSGVLGVLERAEHPVAVHLQLAAVRLGQLRGTRRRPRPAPSRSGRLSSRSPSPHLPVQYDCHRVRTPAAAELGGRWAPSFPTARCLHRRLWRLVRRPGVMHPSAEGNQTMMLKDKVAVIYGAGGAIGGAVARAFADEGADVFLTGRVAGAGRSGRQGHRRRRRIRRGGRGRRARRAGGGRASAVRGRSGGPRRHLVQRGRHPGREASSGVPLADAGRRAVRPADHGLHDVVLPDRAPGGAADGPERIGRDHDRHRAPRADGHPVDRRLRSGAGRQGGAHPQTCPPSSRRTASAWSACGRTACPETARCGRSSSSSRATGMTWEQFQGYLGQHAPTGGGS